ncbi:MAG: tetratricopeptide repeat protein [Syntrophales bacterium]|nr:tetratricopeptide repeat protein [Syntrophales bacterium]
MRRVCAFILIIIAVFLPGAQAQVKSEAERIWEAGEKAYQEGRYREAIVFYEKSYSLCGSNTDCLAANLNGIGTCYEALGDDTRALNYYERALTFARKVEDKDLLGTILFNVGATSYRLARDYERASKLIEESVKLFRELNDKNSLTVALHVLGKVYSTLGQYAKAMANFVESLKIAREAGNTQAIGNNLTLIGRTYYRMGEYEKALTSLEEALKYMKRLQDPQALSITLRDLGDVYSALFKTELAMSYYEEALSIQKKNNLPLELAITLTNLGAFYFDLNELEKALSCYEESAKIARARGDKPLMATNFNNMGHVLAKLGLSDQALSQYRASLELERGLGRPLSLSYVLNNIGMEYFRLGKYEEALNYLKQAFEIDKKLDNPHLMETRLNNIGAVYLKQKKYREAEEVFLMRKRLAPKVAPNRLLHSGLAELYLITGRYDEALKIIMEIPPTWRDNRNRHIEYHTQLGMAYKGKGELKSAANHLYTAVSLTEEMRNSLIERGGFFAGGSYYGRLTPYRELVAVLIEMAEKKMEIMPAFMTFGRTWEEAAFYFAELTKARSLLEVMAGAAKKTSAAEIPDHLKKREDEIKAKLTRLEKRWDGAIKKGEKAIEELKRERHMLQGELDRLIEEIRAHFPRYAALYYPSPVKIDRLPLKDNEVLIEYMISDGGVFVFIMRKNGHPKVLRIAGGKDIIEDEVKALIAPLNEKALEKFSFSLAYKLHGRLFSGVAKEAKEGDQLIIIPDGILGLIPFEALIIEEGKGVTDHLYVGDKYSISYYQSASVLALQRLSEPAKPEITLFAVGNPVFSSEDPRYLASLGKAVKGEPSVGRYSFRGLAIKEAWGKVEKGGAGREIEFPPLPETEEEVKEIARIMGVTPVPPNILLSLEATERNLKRAGLERYRYIHFATHASLPGMVQGVGEPFILLGQVGNTEEDGFLTLSEVAAMKVKADLVVLSACVTGVGKEVEGEGVINFARAFQQAGARSVVISLWEVASQPAVEYMKRFYGYLKAGKSKVEALHLTRREMKVTYPHPFFWAVFILHGEG